MSVENPLWGAPHIHGELLKLGFEVAQSSACGAVIPRRTSTTAAFSAGPAGLEAATSPL
jgi:hypothetical protein